MQQMVRLDKSICEQLRYRECFKLNVRTRCRAMEVAWYGEEGHLHAYLLLVAACVRVWVQISQCGIQLLLNFFAISKVRNLRNFGQLFAHCYNDLEAN